MSGPDTMRGSSTLGAAAARVVESGWLVALVAVPVFFDPHTVRNFDADKILLFRSITILVLAGLAIWGLEAGVSATPIRRNPVVVAMALLTAAWCVSAAFSIAPRTAFWGSYYRGQGLYTWLGYTVIFAAIVLLARQRQQIERIISTAVFASLPPAIYALMQHAGQDPYNWARSAASASRVVGTLGNAIFLSGFLVMIVPLTLARLIEQFVSTSEPTPCRLLLAITYAVILVLQLMAITYSQSRGPLLGLGVGLIIFSVACAAQYRRRWIKLVGTGAAVVAIAGLIAFALPGNRPGLLSNAASTVKVRLLIWQGSIDLLAARPTRAIFGYGPDTLDLAYAPFYPPQIAEYEGRVSIPDRAHNDIFDALIMVGIAGCAAELLLFGTTFYWILRRLGLIGSYRQRNALVGMMSAGGIAAGMILCLFDGGMRFAGIGAAGGLVAGLITWLSLRALRGEDATNGPRPDGFILAGLLGAVTAHFVEIQVGFPTASTRLYFTAFAALAVAIATRSDSVEGNDESRGEKPRTWMSAGVLLPTALIGVVLALLTYEFSVPSIDPAAPGFAVLWLFLAVWLAGLVLLVVATLPSDGINRRFAAGCIYAIGSLALWFAFGSVHLAWINWTPGESTVDLVQEVGNHIGHTATILYVFVLLTTCIPALFEICGGRPLSRRSSAMGGVYLLIVIGGVALIAATNLSHARADAFARLGATLAQGRKWTQARALYEQAQRLQPNEPVYATNLAGVLMEQSRDEHDPGPP